MEGQEKQTFSFNFLLPSLSDANAAKNRTLIFLEASYAIAQGQY
jgi:hypothetical protein